MYVNTKNKVLGLHENTDTNEQRQAVGRRGQKQKEKCGTVEGRLSPAPASTKGHRRSTGKTRWIKQGNRSMDKEKTQVAVDMRQVHTERNNMLKISQIHIKMRKRELPFFPDQLTNIRSEYPSGRESIPQGVSWQCL